jgi:hypothetical protein
LLLSGEPQALGERLALSVDLVCRLRHFAPELMRGRTACGSAATAA